uniref:Ninja-family protein n=1 Tax=Aegilops tauschii subsp. strangulata TaxID=200361 RepID=A0A452ZVH7_AEGTS
LEMEDGLELSLGLSLGGGSSGKSKARDASLEPKAEPQVEESSSKGVSQPPDAPFAHYYQATAENQEHSSKQRHSPATPPFGNFWGQHGGSSAPVADGSSELMPVSSKRKLLSEETSFQKKHHSAADQPDAFSKSSEGGVKNAPISISTDDGSTGENEEVADSEAEGSNSWLVAQREDSAKGSVVNRGSDIKRSSDDATGGFQGKRQPSFSGSESSSGKLPHGNPLQASNVVTAQYQGQTQVSAPLGITNAPNFPPMYTVQLRPPVNNGPAVQAMGGASQVSFGYPTGQLPILETSSSWAFGTPPQAISSFAERAGAKQADDGKKPQEAGASSSALLEDGKVVEKVLPLMGSGSGIRPGIAPNVKFGGSGSYPDLPWVSTTGTGPSGRTISGVTYNFGRNEVKIVCACHGTHMTPEEFTRHASVDATGQENNATMSAFPVGNQAASAQN